MTEDFKARFDGVVQSMLEAVRLGVPGGKEREAREKAQQEPDGLATGRGPGKGA